MKKILFSILLVFTCILTAAASGHTVTISSFSNVTCNGICNGSATTTVSGGIGPFSYSWSPSGGTAATASGLCAGSYTVTVTDISDMSTANATVAITQPPLLSVSISGAGSPVCAGSCVTLNATGSGGTPAYTFSWTPSGTMTPSYYVCPSSTSTYTVTITDSQGCVGNATTSLSVIPLPSTTLTTTNATCGLNNGSISPTGGCSYSWMSTGTPSIGTSLTGLGAATYTVSITCSGCSSTAVTTITSTPAPTVTMPSSYTICSGIASVIGVSPTAGYTYSWSPITALSSATISNPTCAAITTTSYTLVVTDAGGCTATATTTVYVDGPISSGITSTNTTGCGVCDGTANVAPVGGSGPYVYSWGSSSITGKCPGTYPITITDVAGCVITDSTTIFNGNDLSANFTMVPDSANPFNFHAFNSSTGSGAAYSWDFGGMGTSTSANPSFLFGAPGTYNVCLTASNLSCGADTLCVPVIVTGTSGTCLALFNIADDTTSIDPNSHYIYNLSYGSTLSYLWDFGDGTTSTLITPSHIYSGTGPYTICLTVDNGSGCTQTYCQMLISADSINRSSGTLQIVVYNVPPFHDITTGIANENTLSKISAYPNPFTDNTTFIIQSTLNEAYSFELSDMLGKKVRSLNNFSEKQFQVSRSGLQNGIYFYKIYSAAGVVGNGKLVIQ